MAYHKIEETVGGVSVSLETGRIAKQANGAVIARIGDTMVLATACSGNKIENTDFFPLTVEYIAKNYAAGKDPRRLFQARGKAQRKRSFQRSPRGPAPAPAVPQRTSHRNADHRVRHFGR